MNVHLKEGQLTAILTERQEEMMLAAAAEAYAREKARLELLGRVYTVQGLMERLDISESKAYGLIDDQRIDYVCAGKKKDYRITEAAVLKFLGVSLEESPADAQEDNWHQTARRRPY